MRLAGIGAIVLVLLTHRAGLAHALPSYEVMAAECGTRGTQHGMAFVVKPFSQARPAEALWIVTALHVVDGCGLVLLHRGQQVVIRNPASALVWPSRDLVAFPIDRARSGLAVHEQPAYIQSLHEDEIRPAGLYLWSRRDLTQGHRHWAQGRGRATVGQLRQRLRELGRGDHFGSLADDVVLLEYGGSAGDDDSGSAVALAEPTNGVIGMHLSGLPSADASWALLFTAEAPLASPREVPFGDLARGVEGYTRPAMGAALHELRLPQRETESDRVTRAGYWSLGMGLAFATAGAILTTLFWNAGDNALEDLYDRCPPATCALERRQAEIAASDIGFYDDAATWSLVAASAGLAGMAAGGLLLWLSGDQENVPEPKPQPLLRATPTPAGVSLRLSFP